MLLVLIGTNTLNHALKKPQTKNQQKKIVHETVNFYLPNLTKPKKEVVRTSFDLNPEQEWTQAQKVRTINL